MPSKLFTLPIINTTDYSKTIKEINAKRNVIKQDQIKQNPPASFSLRDSNFDYTGTNLQESSEQFIDTNNVGSELEILARLNIFLMLLYQEKFLVRNFLLNLQQF